MKINIFSTIISALLVVLIAQSAYGGTSFNLYFLLSEIFKYIFKITAAEKVSAQDYAYNSTCMNHLRSHIKRELQAAVTYLAMVMI